MEQVRYTRKSEGEERRRREAKKKGERSIISCVQFVLSYVVFSERVKSLYTHFYAAKL